MIWGHYYFLRQAAKGAVLPSAEADGQWLPMWRVERDDEAAEGSIPGSGIDQGDDADGWELA